ncbi:hypothetical protein [Myxococcus eversor]|uniref:hypothetical protein n=1 Tax=Myxococcus eversor TaxID=2709661 RepID=UPI0013D0547E|nr:hypothetical protein [Myxococcus eversor]
MKESKLSMGWRRTCVAMLVVGGVFSSTAWAQKPAPSEQRFAKRFLVILAAEPELGPQDELQARISKQADMKTDFARLSSTDFAGLKPCLQILVANSFASKAEAQAYGGKLKALGVTASVRPAGEYVGGDAARKKQCAPAEVWQAGFRFKPDAHEDDGSPWSFTASAVLKHADGSEEVRALKGRFSNGEVPQDMTRAFSVWWAGGGSDVKLVRKGQALVVLQRFKDEGIDPRKERDVEVARFVLPPQVRVSGLEP